MEFFDLESGLASVAPSGQVLNCQELTGVRAGLAALKGREQHHRVYFWGKVLGQTADYYVAYALKTEFEFPTKVFYFAGADFDFRLLEAPVDEVAEKVADLAGELPLTGVPGTPLEPSAGDDDPPPADDDPDQPPVAQGPKKLTEVDRLALMVLEIDFDTSVVPKGAFELSDTHQVVPSKGFQGLGLTEANALSSYAHFRTPVSLASVRALARADAQFFKDFLDPLTGDLPKGCWTVRQDQFSALVTLRSLHWPGYVAFHVPSTPKYGGVYVGYAQRNIDLPFMI